MEEKSKHPDTICCPYCLTKKTLTKEQKEKIELLLVENPWIKIHCSRPEGCDGYYYINKSYETIPIPKELARISQFPYQKGIQGF